MEHDIKIEYDINFLLPDKDLFQAIHMLKKLPQYNTATFSDTDFLSLSKREFDIQVHHELRESEEAIFLHIDRLDTGKFSIIMSKFDDRYICMRFALDIDYGSISSIGPTVIDAIIHDVCSITPPVCISAGEVVVPYFIQEILDTRLVGDVLYLDESLITKNKLGELSEYRWFYYGNGIMFSLVENKNIPVYKVLLKNK